MIEIDFWRKIKTFIKVIIKVFMKKIAGRTMGRYYTLTHLEFDWMIKTMMKNDNEKWLEQYWLPAAKFLRPSLLTAPFSLSS